LHWAGLKQEEEMLDWLSNTAQSGRDASWAHSQCLLINKYIMQSIQSKNINMNALFNHTLRMMTATAKRETSDTLPDLE
jgi:hypothetical protein